MKARQARERKEQEQEERRQREEEGASVSVAKMLGYAVGVSPLVRAELAREVATQFDYERLRAIKEYLHTSADASSAVNTLHNDLLDLYRVAVEGLLQALGAMTDTELTEENRQALIEEQTQACADVGLQAIKRSDLVREMLGENTSQPSNHSGSSNGVKIEKKRSWRELRGNAYRT